MLTTSNIRYIARIWAASLILLLCLVFLVPGSVSAQTVPTRTPVPGGGGGGGGGSAPTSTPQAQPTATASRTPPAVTLAPTPVEGFITPEACGIPLFQASRGTVNVRQAPVASSEVVAILVFLETRQIVGRSAAVEWWRILLPDGRQGWVANAAGTVYGNTGGLPALDNEGVPVDSGSWLPTPDPACPTPTATLTASATPTPTASPSPTRTSEPTATATPLPTTTATMTVAPTATTPAPTATPAKESPAADPPAPAAEDPEASTSPNWLLITGVITLLAGLAAFIIQQAREQRQA